MKTVGQMLREARIAKQYSLSDVEAATKIRLKFVDAIESDNYGSLPSLSYAKGFVKNYSDFLGLDSKKVLAFFRRQTVEVGRSSILPKGVAQPLNRSTFQLTPAKFIWLVLGVLIAVFLLYFVFQYQSLQQPPVLVVDAPTVSAVVKDKRIDIIGKTDPDATVTVNGISVLVRSDGRFFDQITLETGINKVTIVATSRLGKTTTVIRDVGLQPAESLTE